MSNLNIERQKRIKEVREFAERIMNACDELQEGATETKSCQKYNIDINFFRRLNGYAQKGYKVPGNKTIKMESFQTREEFFLSQLYGTKVVEVPQDFDKSLDVVLSRLLDREATAIREFYFQDRTLEEIGEGMYVSAERAEQVISKAMNKIRKPHNLIYFTNGYEFSQAREKANIKLEEHKSEIVWMQLVSDKIDEIDDLKSKPVQNYEVDQKIKDSLLLNNYKYVEDLFSIPLDIVVQKYIKDQDPVDIMDKKWTPIDDLNLSVRTYNCLIRSGIRTVNDVLMQTTTELQRIRNLGAGSYRELKEKINQLGYELTEPMHSDVNTF